VELATPTPLEWTVTPQAYAMWLPEVAKQVTPTAAAPITLNMREVTLAMLPGDGEGDGGDEGGAGAPLRLDAAQSTVFADLALPAMQLRWPDTQRTLDVKGGGIEIQGEDLSDVIKVLTNLTIEDLTPNEAQRGEQSDAQAAPSGLRSTTEVRSLVNDRGEVLPGAARYQTDTTLNAVPVFLVDASRPAGMDLAAVLGPSVSASLKGHYQGARGGEMTAEVRSTNVRGRVVAGMAERDVVTLREQAAFDVDVTPEVSRVMLAKFSPILADVVSAGAPIDLTLEAQPSSVPIDPFNWRGVEAQGNLAGSSLRLGEGLVTTVLGLLSRYNVINKDFQSVGTLRPVAFTIESGMLGYDDLTFDMNGITLGLRGEVDLATEQLHNMRLVVGGEELDDAGIGPIALDLTGTINNPKLAKGALEKALIGAGLHRGLRELLNGDRDRSRQQEERKEDSDADRTRDAVDSILRGILRGDNKDEKNGDGSER